jgi:serine protease AprX
VVLHPRGWINPSMARSVLALGTLLSLVTCVLTPATRGAAPDRRAMAGNGHALAASAWLRVIIQTDDPAAVGAVVTEVGGRNGRRLPSMQAVVAELPGSGLARVSAAPMVRRISVDRPLRGALEVTGTTIGARWVSENLGFDGAGVGVAIIDSGVTRSHDDLGANKVAHFADFVDFQAQPHDGYGHGTHVAGIIAGNGYDSGGARRGIAPGAHLVVLKALDEQGDGYISSAIAAIDYAIEQRTAYNIRVINLSVAAGVFESYNTDPLTLAARRAVDAGIVVVTAAGNLGRNAKGHQQSGGITAPGNAPWVLTVGASSHNGTVDPADDTIASFSSLGPSLIDAVPKPDLLAPGVGIESLADAGSTLFTARPAARRWGTVATTAPPYMSLSGTSMAAPVVAGTVALMLQANPALTPGAVKALLQSSADPREGYGRFAQGAGFLNARAAVELSQAFSDADAISSLDEAAEVIAEAAAAPCSDLESNCAEFQELCSTAACFGELDAALVGVAAPEAESVVWPPQPAATERRKPRVARRRRRRTTTGNTGVSR